MSEEVLDAAPEVAEEVSEELSEGFNSEEATPEDLPEGAGEAIADALDNGEITEEQAVEMIKQLTIKVDGQEIVKELPFEVDPKNEAMIEYLKKELQMSTMSQKRAEEASSLRKAKADMDSNLEAFLDTLKNNPRAVLKQMGIDPVAFSEETLNSEAELMELSPEERKIRELETQLKEINEAKENAKKAEEQAKFEALQEREATKVQDEIMRAIDSGELSNDPYTINRLANMMVIATNQGIDVSFNDLVPLFKNEMKSNFKSFASRLSADDILEYLGDEQVKELILKKTPKKPVAKKVPPTANSVKESGVKKEVKSNNKPKASAEDFFSKLTRGQIKF